VGDSQAAAHSRREAVAVSVGVPELGGVTGQTIVVDGGQVLPESLEALGP
jgi:hypothetical protein